MKFLIVTLLLSSVSTYAFDVMLTKNNPSMDVQTLVDSGATAVTCEKVEAKPFPRCILNLGASQTGIQNKGQDLKEVSFLKHRNPDTAIGWVKKLKEEGLCN